LDANQGLGPVRTAGPREMLFDPTTRSWTRVYSGPPPRIAVAPGKLEIDAMRRSRRGVRDFATNVPPPPGGLGGGVSFISSKLPYRQATAISFRLSAPETGLIACGTRPGPPLR
jgi:hypothetical protein